MHKVKWSLAFIEGVDPSYNKIISDYLSEYFEKYPDYILDSIENVEVARKQEFLKKLKEIGHSIIKDFNKRLQDYRETFHVNPITNAVSFLPKRRTRCYGRITCQFNIVQKEDFVRR